MDDLLDKNLAPGKLPLWWPRYSISYSNDSALVIRPCATLEASASAASWNRQVRRYISFLNLQASLFQVILWTYGFVRVPITSPDRCSLQLNWGRYYKWQWSWCLCAKSQGMFDSKGHGSKANWTRSISQGILKSNTQKTCYDENGLHAQNLCRYIPPFYLVQQITQLGGTNYTYTLTSHTSHLNSDSELERTTG